MERKYNITKENARENQKRSIEKRLENNEKRFFLQRSTRDKLTEKKKPDEEDLANAKYVGVKLGKNPTVGETVIVAMLARLKRDGDVRGFIELLKMSGMHFDQSVDALGGAENPINVQTTTVAPEQVKEISKELEGCC